MNWFNKVSQQNNSIQLIANKMKELGWKYELPSIENDNQFNINPNALNIGDYTYPTLISPDNKVKLALSTQDIYMHKGRVWISSPNDIKINSVVLAGIIVDPSERRKGRGNAAMQQLLEVCRELGIKITIEPVPISTAIGKNKPGLSYNKLVKWYKNMGFKNRHPDSNQILELDPNENDNQVK